ncbi:hypothetical protein EXE58_08975 [Nocardioides seonyuensis]|uniref:Uncharacterized protein n=1 Tax=Nocardioides seonyuensis TaxID=2518371 RepID=A0A4V1BM93_9ACTN|nr:hypothetical protein [Nocardioides seonyuensis]QBX55572.1 hypothetical protein EXE58_08975 [Nocardioides seonyuensis]
MKHRREVALWQSVVISALTFTVGALASWSIGGLATEAVKKVSDRGPLAADVTVSGSLGGNILPLSRSELIASGAPTHMTLNEYADAVGGWAGGHTLIDLNLYGLAAYPVVIDDIKLTKVKCSPPSAGPYTFLREEGGGNLVGLEMIYEIEGSSSSVRGVPDPSHETFAEAEEQRWDFPRQVSQAEADRFKLGVSAPDGQLCEFEVTVDYRANGEDGHLSVEGDSGVAFRVADVKVADELLTDTELYATRD